MPSTPSQAPARAQAQRTAFRLEVSVSARIAAPPARIWQLLTSAADFPRWNSTVQSLEGTIAAGQTLRLRVPVAPGRVFKPKVAELVPEQRMVWRDGMLPFFRGVRTFTLSPSGGGATDFRMTEVFSGLMLPLVARSLPDFVPVFEQYAADLKRAAEQAAAPTASAT